MKKINIFWLMCFWLICFSCSKDSDVNESKISIDEAKELIEIWNANKYHTVINPSPTFSIEEITTNEIWDKMHAQVFNFLLPNSGFHNRGFYIKNKTVFDLGRKNLMAAYKLDNLVVSDLDKDKIYELCFLLTHGSGLTRTDVVCYINELDDSYIFADTSFWVMAKIKLEKENLNTVFLKQINKEGEKKIGDLNLVKENSTMKLTIKK